MANEPISFDEVRALKEQRSIEAVTLEQHATRDLLSATMGRQGTNLS